MDLLHGLLSALHRVECFLVDVRRFDGRDFAFDCHHLGGGLFELVFKGLFPSKGGFGDYMISFPVSVRSIDKAAFMEADAREAYQLCSR